MSKPLVFAGLVMTALFPVPASARTTEVVVDKMAFGVVPSNLSVGDTIVWINRDIFRHSATAAGHFDVDLPPGSRRRMVLRRPGAFGFVCKYHPGMKGIVRVSR